VLGYQQGTLPAKERLDFLPDRDVGEVLYNHGEQLPYPSAEHGFLFHSGILTERYK
jgi:hypothetical protein